MTATIVAYHRDGYADGRPAIDVKVRHAWGQPEHELAEVVGTDEAERLLNEAFEQIAEDFWKEAAEVARQGGLGPIEQEGRMGGWLVFTDGQNPAEPDTIDECDDEDCRANSVREWLAAYRRMAEWCAEQVRACPRRVVNLARRFAMDAVGEDAARRMFGPARFAVLNNPEVIR